ncbi:RICIN domain-containing protein [Actinoplanes sp. KI2]|uniref:RICIN domain-containing protein n=1 Tax=Actinoplanes sp. KI2 TaxID=2983315 RepID=UPI0021D5C274|nr:RICIN domain-containing protein [Actinoplanes sp. KI2]MCU7725213.1 RICIN domain-containing protein [Actinoplanes sp. KI2]
MSTRRIVAAVLASLATTVALLPGTPAHAVAGDGWYRIVNIKSGLALQGRTDQNGVGVIQTYDTSSLANGGYTDARQDWLKVHISGSNYAFRNAAANWAALTVSSGASSTTKPIIQWTYSASQDQVWELQSGGSANVFVLRNPASNKCLAIPNGSTATGVQAIIWTCNGGQEQKWRVIDNA